MKRIVWKNKSNGQLCVTIPKNSGVREGDIVSAEKEKITTIVYSVVTGDLFHYGQLRLLQAANDLGDFHICGVLTGDAIKTYKSAPIASLKERSSIISSLRCVDMVITQDHKDPTTNLQQIHKQFPFAQIILVYGSNWKKVPGHAFIKKIGGKVIQPPFYEKLSMDNIIKKIKEVSNIGP
jgi:bifunctional ADP-heptose synthase (sugar kinase/adenylyltransferase)